MTGWRTGPDELAASARDALVDVFEQHRFTAGPGRGRGTLTVRAPSGRKVNLAVSARSRLDASQVADAIGDRPRSAARPFIVADEITRDARRELREAGIGFLDRRGHLYLRTDDLYIDIDTSPTPRSGSPAPLGPPVRGRAGLTVVSGLLLHPDERLGVREIGRRTGLPPSTVSKALRPVHEAHLIDDGRPVIPDLFWELAAAWSPNRSALAERPPDGAGVTSGSNAAAALSAPIAVSADAPPDLYVPSEAGRRALERRYGTAPLSARAATVAVEPTSLVTATAENGVAHPLFVALDLAMDRARGREILAGWNPSEARRVW
jgi:hypothetical protein